MINCLDFENDTECYDNLEISGIRCFNWAQINCAIWILDIDFKLPVKYNIHKNIDIMYENDNELDWIFDS